ncbi:helix-turn-helix domain-containing protein [Sediminibacterium salmoneum]|uniref:helix-turn-helix domain-containing protein n=1 Tax=Sediminibacterium salmoneum TaxID=426421 RepID=UPI00047B5953|nr:helix-turn-helix transcriptional regulator [Sediminibacterium salmoneum]
MNTIVYFFTVLKSSKKNTHRGQLLKRLVAENGISISKLVKKVGISRSSFYNHIEDPDLSVDILIKYGQVLHVNILDMIAPLDGQLMSDALTYYPMEEEPKNLREANLIIQSLRKKYIALLEENKLLLEQLNQNN